MSEKHNTKGQIVIQGAAQVSISQANDQAQAIQNNLYAPQPQLLSLLSQLMAATDSKEPDHAQIRAACRKARDELEETQALSSDTGGLLQRAIKAFPATDKALDIVTKVADLFGKVPGLGAGPTQRAARPAPRRRPIATQLSSRRSARS